MKQFLILVSICFSISLFSQNKSDEAKIILSKASNLLKKEYCFQATYKLYKKYKGNEIEDTYNGLMFHNKNGTYVKIKDTEFVSLSNLSFKINHEEKAFITQDFNQNDQSLNLDTYLKGFDLSLEDFDKNTCIINIIPRKTTPPVFSKAMYFIDKTTYQIKKQVIYMLEQLEYIDQKGKTIQSFPRLETTYFPKKITSKENLLLERSRYYSLSKDKKLIFSSLLKNYEHVSLN